MLFKVHSQFYIKKNHIVLTEAILHNVQHRTIAEKGSQIDHFPCDTKNNMFENSLSYL